MKRRTFLTLLATIPLTSFAQTAAPEKGGERKRDASLAPITDTPGLPRVLLIGDSISMGYTVPVRELLAGKANVHRIPENGSSTQAGLEKLSKWIGDGKWDVIHFNWGLHDLKHWKDNKLDLTAPVVTPLDEYEKNLRTLVTQLKASGAKLIWASTTPVPEGSAGRVAGDDARYNEVAARVMKSEGVAINDLNAFSKPRLAEIQLPKNVHFTADGSRTLAQKVAESISTYLPKR